MDNIDEIVENLIGSIPKVVKYLRQNLDEIAYKEFGKIIIDLNKVMLTFINAIPSINQLGLDIPADVVVAQLKNTSDGFEFRDNVLLADALEYEIMDSLKLYSEILAQI